jgi:GntR family transcriptional regulator, transcriptional repressor for pyruvate dehydrogenase complex
MSPRTSTTPLQKRSNLGDLARLPVAARAQQAAAAIETAIRSGRFPKGSTLPPERTLAMTLGLSRPALREAIRTLAERGMLEPRHGIGTIVLGDEHRPIADALGRALGGKRDAHLQVHEVRELLEGAIVRRAAARATNAQRAQLKKLHKSYLDAGDNRDQLAAIDADFHRSLARATGNPLFETMLAALRQAMTNAQRLAMEHCAPADIASQHAAIIAAIDAKDPDAAVRAMDHHLATVRHALG